MSPHHAPRLPAASPRAAHRRRDPSRPPLPWLVPEVLQTSALDCGPAALAAILAGCGRPCPFDALRDACRTGRDGTSIDTLETVAADCGLDAEQVLVPADHLALPEAACLPCILVVLLPGGAAHFVVLWRRHGRRVQVMDPAVGRRWPHLERLDRDIYRHRTVVPAAAWRTWAASADLLVPLDRQLAALGLAAAGRRALLDAAAGAPGWRPLATLDACTRFTRHLAAARAVRRGRDAARLLAALLDREQDAAPGAGIVPAAFWTARPPSRPAPATPPAAERDDFLLVEGALLVRVRGWRHPEAPQPLQAPPPPLSRTRPAPRRAPRSGAPPRFSSPPVRDADPTGPPPARPPAAPPHATPRGLLATRAGATAAGAAARLVETLLWTAILELLPTLPSWRLRLGALGALLVYGVAAGLLDLAAAAATAALGRRREIGLRAALAAKLPRLSEAFLRTRLLSDLAERAHLLGRLRRGPDIDTALLRASLETLLAAAGIAWLDPALALGAFSSAAAAVLLPRLLLPRLRERAHRVRAHAAALGTLHLDALRGLDAVRAHGAHTALRRRHDQLLACWLRARRSATAAATALESTAHLTLAAVAVALLLAHLSHRGLDAQTLPLALWIAHLLAAGRRAAWLAGADLPLDRVLLRRIEEPLRSPDDGARARPPAAPVPHPSDAPTEPPSGPWTSPTISTTVRRSRAEQPPEAVGAAHSDANLPRRPAPGLRLQDIGLQLDGRWLLREINLAIPAGQHVALLGSSGAGKSTLFSLLLGWHPPTTGHIEIAGRPLCADTLNELRGVIAWTAPEVALWNDTLLANLLFGSGTGRPSASPAAFPRPRPDVSPNPHPAAPAGTVAAAQAPSIPDLAPIEALRAADLLDLLPQLPDGLQTPLGEAGGRLSGGEAQRLRFARALLRPAGSPGEGGAAGHPGVRLALLDEPFRGLAANQRRALLATARAHWRHATLLCISHSPAEAMDFDSLLVLEEGRLVESGAPRQLAAHAGSRYHAMLAAEARVAAALQRPAWRRLHLAAGRIEERSAAGEPHPASRTLPSRARPRRSTRRPSSEPLS
jgi:ABC-type bacteriocin/lantibiotic exporter with double-glycine peptidase domain